jgi:hypothetical protein
LLNVFGQRPENLVVSAGGAELEVYSPTTVRSGIYFMSRFTIVPEQEIADATLVLVGEGEASVDGGPTVPGAQALEDRGGVHHGGACGHASERFTPRTRVGGTAGSGPTGVMSSSARSTRSGFCA